VAALLALLSSLVWGTADFMGGTLSRRIHPIAVLAGSQPFGLLATALTAIILGQWKFESTVVTNGSIAGLCGLAGLIAFYSALASGRMGIVSPISSLGVVIPLAIGLVQGDKPTPVQLIGVIVAIVGVVMASGPELSGGAPVRPVVLSALAALFFGGGIYFMAVGGSQNPSMTVVMMRVTQVAILCVIALVVRQTGGMKRSDLPYVATTGVLDASANVLYTSAAALGMLSLVSVLGSLFPVVTTVLAWRVHHERLTLAQYIGIAATVCGVVAITVG
jgi:drug/metabolite transporter (DMT)-like permease